MPEKPIEEINPFFKGLVVGLAVGAGLDTIFVLFAVWVYRSV
jgi:hypothetical protein